MTLLPRSDTDERCDSITDERLQPGVQALCALLGYGPEHLTKFTEGTLPVYDLDDELVLKLYPATGLTELAVEEPVMRALHGRLPVPTPEVIATGRFDGWGYLLMTKLRGTDLRTLWPVIDRDAKRTLARQAGEALAALHTVPVPSIGPADWNAFIAGQTATAAARQERLKLDPFWVEQIPGFLATVELSASPDVLLHTEYMDVHLLAEQRSGGFALTGLVDFEPSMRGNPEYDLLLPAVYLAQGDKAVWREFLIGYGFPLAEAPALARRLMAYAMLHRFARLPKYFQVMPATQKRTFPALAEHWFGI